VERIAQAASRQVAASSREKPIAASGAGPRLYWKLPIIA
jgi:hypothetical protein